MWRCEDQSHDTADVKVMLLSMLQPTFIPVPLPQPEFPFSRLRPIEKMRIGPRMGGLGHFAREICGRCFSPGRGLGRGCCITCTIIASKSISCPVPCHLLLPCIQNKKKLQLCPNSWQQDAKDTSNKPCCLGVSEPFAAPR